MNDELLKRIETLEQKMNELLGNTRLWMMRPPKKGQAYWVIDNVEGKEYSKIDEWEFFPFEWGWLVNGQIFETEENIRKHLGLDWMPWTTNEKDYQAQAALNG